MVYQYVAIAFYLAWDVDVQDKWLSSRQEIVCERATRSVREAACDLIKTLIQPRKEGR